MNIKGVLGGGLLAAALTFAPGAVALGGPVSSSDATASPESASAAAPATTDENTLEESTAADTAPAAVNTGRLAGKDRYGTSVSISHWRFKDPSDADKVYLARADVFADALTAGVLTDGPILLVPGGCAAPRSVVLQEVERIDPEAVVALGGDQSVCEAQLEAAANGRPNARLGGADRAETAAIVGMEAFPEGAATVYLARGNSSPDAMVGGALTDGPILLTNQAGTRLPDSTRAAIKSIDPERVIALGGKSSVTSSVLIQAADGRATGRLAGSNRYATSVQIAERAFPSGNKRVYLARGDGDNLADAVASGVLVDGPVVLVNGPCVSVPQAVKDYLGEVQPTTIVGLGGQDSVCTNLLEQAAAAATPPPPPPATPDCNKVKCVALTFDDGPSAYTSQLVDTLDELDVPATFFAVGQAANARPNTIKRSFDHGYSIQNHTWDHPQLNLLPLSEQRSQYTSTRDLLTSLGITPTTMLRPPYGAWNPNTRKLGVPLILWSIDTRDWENRNTAQIRANVRNNIHNGAIVLQHDTIPETVAAVPGIVSDLRGMGYHFVTVEDLVPWAGPGDLVYSRGQVVDASVEAVPEVVDGADFVAPPAAAELPQN